MSQKIFDLALQDYDAAFMRQPMNASYVHAKGKAYEAIAAEIQAKFGKRKRFDLEPEISF